MGRPYTQLSMTEREQIELELRRGSSWEQIGALIGRAASTVWREAGRNAEADGFYRSRRADALAHSRRHVARKPRRLASTAQRDFVHRRLRVGWSPQHIERRGPLAVSCSTIYREAHGPQREHWPQLLRGVPRSETRRKLRRQRIHDRVMIDVRPAVVDRRSRVGDWEGDTIRSCAGSGACLLTLVERRTRLVRAALLPERTAAILNATAFELLRDMPVLTLTVDNGMEFASHKQLSALIGAPVFFAHEKSPWERALNEQTNGLIRHYVPRGCDLADYTPEYIHRVQRLLNRRPRLCLNALSPEESMVTASLHLK